MNALTDLPNNNYSFGHNFNYAQWAANSSITLTNVPWNNTYRDIVRFSNRAALNNFIESQNKHTTVINNMTIIKPNEPIVVDLPFNVAAQFNYLRARNPKMPVAGDQVKDYYYFVLGVEYLAPNATRMLIELDVWSTYFTSITFDNCYVERGHVAIANNKQFTDYGRKYLTVPEGLDLGSEYQPVYGQEKQIFGTSGTVYDFMITSTISLTAAPGTAAEPEIRASRGSAINPFNLATESYVIKYGDLQTYFQQMSQYPWIMQGIVEIKLIPALSTLGIAYSNVPRTNNYPPGGSSSQSYLHYASGLNGVSGSLSKNNFRNEIKNTIPEKYRGLNKFLTSPYSLLTVTTHDANPIFFKPELFKDATLQFEMSGALMPGNQAIRFTPFNYNDFYGSAFVAGERKQYSCIYDRFPTFPVLNNSALINLASSARSTAQAYDNAAWGKEISLAGAQVAYDNSTAAMQAAIDAGEISRDVDERGTAIGNKYAIGSGITSIGGGAVGGAMAGGPAGAVAGAALGAAGVAMGVMRNNEELALRNYASIAQQNVSTRQGQTVRANNNNLAQTAAKGDYQNQVAALNARQQDIMMVPPSVTGQLSGEFLKILQGVSFHVVYKRIPDSAITKIGEFWLRYGYAVHQFLKPPSNLHCMSKFTYWKMLETYITGNIPEYYKNVVRGIFEKGVTVWQSPTDIGKIDTSTNTPLAGVSY